MRTFVDIRIEQTYKILMAISLYISSLHSEKPFSVPNIENALVGMVLIQDDSSGPDVQVCWKNVFFYLTLLSVKENE